MNRDNLVGLVEVAVLILALYLLFGYLFVTLNAYGPGLIFLILGFSVAATVLLSVLFLPKFSLMNSSAPPERVLDHVTYQLRRRGFRVEEGPDSATIRLGSTAAVRIHVWRSLAGSRVGYQAFATPAGWGTLVTLIVIPWAAPAGLGAQLYVFRKARQFARNTIAPLVHEAESAGPSRPEDETRALLISGLSESHRLAAEAYEALRSAYGDWLVLAAFAAILAWAIVFVVLVFSPALRPLPGDLLTTMLTAVAAGVGTAAILVALIRWRVRPLLARCRSWSDRMRDALSREAIRASPGTTQPSSIELLLDASRQIPSWLEARRRAGLSADQAADWLVFVVSLGAFWALFYGIDRFLAGDFFGGSLGLLAGTGSGCGAYLLWAYWKRERDAAIARTREEWRRRMDALQSRLDQFVQDL